MQRIRLGIQEGLERGRFHTLFAPVQKKHVSKKILAHLTKQIVDKARKIGRKRARWDAQFQGYKLTWKMLQAIQNQTYMYRVTLFQLQCSYSVSGVLGTAVVGVSKKIADGYARKFKQGVGVERKRPTSSSREKRGNWKCQAQGTLHLSKLKIFDCSHPSRTSEKQHQAACAGERKGPFAAGLEWKKDFFAVVREIEIFDKSYPDALEQAGRALSRGWLRKLFEVGPFRIHVPVTRVTTNSAYLGVGKNENLRLNQGYKIYLQHVRGHLIYKGFARIRSVGDNRVVMKGNRKIRVDEHSPFHSRSQILAGSGLQKGMLAFEYAQRGIGLEFGAIMGYMGYADLIDDKKRLGLGTSSLWEKRMGHHEGQWMPMLRLASVHDVSHRMGSSEVYLEFLLDGGFASFSGETGFDWMFPLAFHIGMKKKFYFRRLAWIVGARLGFGLTITNSGLMVPLGGELFTGFELFISPEFSLGLQIGGRAQMTLYDQILYGVWSSLGGTYSF